MIVEWTPHGLARANERGAFIKDAPLRKIAKLGNLVQIGEEFHVKDPTIIWVCKRIGVSSIYIVTVLINYGQNKAPKQRRDHVKNKRRLQRRDKQRARDGFQPHR